MKHDYSEAELTHLMAHDANAFNRWEAGQRLALELMLRGIAARREATIVWAVAAGRAAAGAADRALSCQAPLTVAIPATAAPLSLHGR